MQNHPKIGIPIGTEIHYFYPGDMLYCIEEGGFAHLVLQQQKRLVLQRNLEYITRHLPDFFLCIHPSYLINTQHLEKYLDEEKGRVLMSDGQLLPVSSDRKEQLLQHFQLL